MYMSGLNVTPLNYSIYGFDIYITFYILAVP